MWMKMSSVVIMKLLGDKDGGEVMDMPLGESPK
jgi:hypothetical protein